MLHGFDIRSVLLSCQDLGSFVGSTPSTDVLRAVEVTDGGDGAHGVELNLCRSQDSCFLPLTYAWYHPCCVFELDNLAMMVAPDMQQLRETGKVAAITRSSVFVYGIYL